MIHSLDIDDFSDDNYTLIGIHTTLEDYKLAYLLNKQLDLRFFKMSDPIELKKNNTTATFWVYEFENAKLQHQWYLIANICKGVLQPIVADLFADSETVVYLIPEKKKVDFFIKLEGDFTSQFLQKILHKINQIDQVITSYTIEVDTLKSKEFLIF